MPKSLHSEHLKVSFWVTPSWRNVKKLFFFHQLSNINDAKEKTSNELDSTKQKIEFHTKNIKVLQFKLTFSLVKRQIYYEGIILDIPENKASIFKVFLKFEH